MNDYYFRHRTTGRVYSVHAQHGLGAIHNLCTALRLPFSRRDIKTRDKVVEGKIVFGEIIPRSSAAFEHLITLPDPPPREFSVQEVVDEEAIKVLVGQQQKGEGEDGRETEASG